MVLDEKGRPTANGIGESLFPNPGETADSENPYQTSSGEDHLVTHLTASYMNFYPTLIPPEEAVAAYPPGDFHSLNFGRPGEVGRLVLETDVHLQKSSGHDHQMEGVLGLGTEASDRLGLHYLACPKKGEPAPSD